MRRTALGLVLCCLCCLAPAVAAAVDAVPLEHWAYGALDYLSQQGVLEGYPAGYFSGDRAVSRYEFSQAIARLLQADNAAEHSEQVAIMLESLRAEFADEAASACCQLLEGVESQAQAVAGRLADAEEQAATGAAAANELEAKAAGLKPGPAWTGSLRYRWQFDDCGATERFRQRIIFQLGYTKKVDDAVEAGFRLKTITGADQVGSLQDLGNNLKSPRYYLDRAYVKYSPRWFGCYMNQERNPVLPRVDIYAGMYPSPLADPNAAIMDADVNQHGLGLVYHFNQEFQILSVASVAAEAAGSNYFNDDAYFLAAEAKHTNLLLHGLDAWLGCYAWKGESYLPNGTVAGMPNDFANNMLGGVDLNNDGVVNGLDRFSSDFTTVKAGLQYTRQCAFNRPLRLFAEYMLNIDSDAEDRIAAYNATPAAAGQELFFESSDDRGIVAGAQYGADPVQPGEWCAFARYKETGANTIVHGFGDNVFGGANRNGLDLSWNYVWAENSSVGITYYLVKMHNAFGQPVPAGFAERNTLQLDWLFKF